MPIFHNAGKREEQLKHLELARSDDAGLIQDDAGLIRIDSRTILKHLILNIKLIIYPLLVPQTRLAIPPM